MRDWTEDAACIGIPTDLYFPEQGTSANATDVKMLLRICGECTVASECLAEALELEGDCGRNRRFGIWGGKTPQQRHKMVKGARKQKRRDDNLCPKGLHEMTPENTYTNPVSELRECRACRTIQRDKYKRNKALRVS